jgi:adenosylcobinamide-phosphate synthase
MTVALTFLAMLIELCCGYPAALSRAIGHPVAWIGRLIAWLDRALNRATASPAARRAAGTASVLILLAIVGAIAVLVQSALLRSPLGILAASLLASTLIAQRSLHRHVADVAAALATGSVAAGRQAVAHIVGRDTETLDAAGVARAAIESLAENFSDAIVAPAFWMGIGGLPGAALYKAINTADSMIGHRTERHQAFGWAAARLDDLVNLAPVRAFADCSSGAPQKRLPQRRLARRTARRAKTSLAQCRLPGSRHGRRARPLARRAAHLWRSACRRRFHGGRPA